MFKRLKLKFEIFIKVCDKWFFNLMLSFIQQNMRYDAYNIAKGEP